MTIQQLKWLQSPETELATQPEGTMAIMRTNNGLTTLVTVAGHGEDGSGVRVRCHPTQGYRTLTSMLQRKAQFALLS